MLLAGVIVGFMFLYGMKRRQERSDLERADLEAKRDALIGRLREGADPALEREAAEVLWKLENVEPTLSRLEPAGEPALRSSALKGFAWGAASVAILAGIGWFVMQSAKPKDAFAQLQQSVEKNPDNLSLRDDLAKAYLDRENLNGVAEQTRYVLQRNPNDARALTYQALVHMAARQPETAAEMLQRATESDPNLIDAWVGIAWLSAENGDLPRAQAAIDEAKRRHPEAAPRLDELMTHLRPPTPLHITLTLADGVTPPARGVIFIIARATGVTAGPPAAVKRLPLGAFPMTVDLTSADSMMGQPLPAKLRLEARIDSDGDPLTRDPKDPSAFVDGVAVGQSMTLTLR